MYKDRLRKWGITKNVKASDINTLHLMNRSNNGRHNTITTPSPPDRHQDGAAPSDSSTSPRSFSSSPGSSEQPTREPEFFIVGSRIIRSDRLQQALQRRAALARRAMAKTDRQSHPYPVPMRPPETLGQRQKNQIDGPFLEDLPAGAARLVWQGGRRDSSIIRPVTATCPTPYCYQPAAPVRLRLPEQILQNSQAFIQGLFDLPLPPASPSSSRVLISPHSPIQTLRLTFEETLGTLTHLDPTPNRTRFAFSSLNAAFALFRPCITGTSSTATTTTVTPAHNHDPQFLLILTQLLALCIYFRRPEILSLLVGYLHELTAVVLGATHPLARVCRDLWEMATTVTTTRKRRKGGLHEGRWEKEKDEEEEKLMIRRMSDICQNLAESSWRLLSTHLYPHAHQIDDVFVHLTATYGDVLDSLGRADKNEAFLRYVLEERMMSPPPPAPPPPHSIPPNDDDDTDPSLSSFTLPTITEEPPSSSSPVRIDLRIRLEVHLILALRRRGKYPEALARIHRIRAEIAQLSNSHSPSHAHLDEDAIADMNYEALRVNGLCEIGRGDLAQGRALLEEAFELMQATRGRYHPRTTRALRDCVRWAEQGSLGQEGLMRELEERLARVSLEGEGLL